MKNKIVIVGAGGLGKEIAVLITDINRTKQEYDLVGFYDDGKSIGEQVTAELDIVGSIADLNQLKGKTAVAVAIGDPKVKKAAISKLNNKDLYFPSLVHPLAWLGDQTTIEIGDGAIITANTSITTDIKIGRFVLINLNVTVGHEVKIGDYSSIMPGANIAGQVQIEEQVLIGAGANIINGKKVGGQAKIGAGATVITEIPSGATAVGVPAKIVKRHELEGI